MSMSIATINPATGETLATFDPMTDDEVDERIAAAHEAFATYRTTTYAERAHRLGAAADLLDDERDDVARMMTTEMGKTLSAARAQAAQCAARSEERRVGNEWVSTGRSRWSPDN